MCLIVLKEKLAGCFALIVFLMSCGCYGSLAVLQRAMGWSAVYVWLWYFPIILTYFMRVLDIIRNSMCMVKGNNLIGNKSNRKRKGRKPESLTVFIKK